MDKNCKAVCFVYVRWLGKDAKVIWSEDIYLEVVKAVNRVLVIFIIHSTKKILSKFFFLLFFFREGESGEEGAAGEEEKESYAGCMPSTR